MWHPSAPVLAVLTVLGLLSGCSSAPERADAGLPQGTSQGTPDMVPKVEPRSRYGNPASYVVFGKRYHTKDDSHGHVERGLASWYGPGFHGRRTSSGERYDMYAMTAAHKTLPLPTYAQVTNLENGRSAVVRINDRGPFHGPRVIDLSRAAAAKLGVLAKGTAQVEVKALDPTNPEPATANPFLIAAKESKPQPFLDGFDSPASATGAESPRQTSAGRQAIADAGRSLPVSRAAPAKATPSRELVAVPAPKAKVDPAARRPAPATMKVKAEVQVAAADAGAAKGQVDTRQARSEAKSDIRPDQGKTLADDSARTSKADAASRGMYVQVGAFGNRSNAEHLRQRLSKELAKLQVKVRSNGGDSSALYKVQVGPLVSRAKASDVSQQLAALGVTQSHVVVE